MNYTLEHSKKKIITLCDPRWLSRYSDLLLVGRSGDQIAVREEVLRTHPDRSWSPPSLLHNG